MNRLKKWLVETYLPAYTRVAMQEEQERLRRRLEREVEKNQQLRAYADGLEYALEALGRQDVRVLIGGGEDGSHPRTV